MITKNEELSAATKELEQKILSAQKLQWDDIQDALSYITMDRDKGLYGLTCYHAAFYMIHNGRQEECLYYLNQSIRCMMGTEQESNLSRCYNMLGVVAHSQNNLILAMEHYEKALKYARQFEQRFIYSLAVGNMADVYLRVASYGRAVSCYRECIRELEKIEEHTANEENMYCKALTGYGHCLILTNKLPEAELVAQKLRQMDLENTGDAAVRLAVYGFFAFLSYCMGETEEANSYTDRAMQIMFDGCTISEDFDNILNLIRYLIRVEKYDKLGEILDCLEPWAEAEHNEGFLLQMLFYRLQYCSDDMDQDSFLQETQAFFKLKDKYERTENSQILRMMSLSNMLREVEEEQTELIRKNSELIYQTEHDELSGLYNKRCLNRYMEKVFEEALHKKIPLGVLFVDIDYFKEMNDRYGHQKGDSCIIAIADAIKTCMPEAFAARYGGDEFVVITIGQSREDLQERAQTLIDNVKAGNIPNVDSKEMNIVTITVGAVHAIPQKPNKMWDFLTAADETLYQQKSEQKGCVRFYVGKGENL